MCLLYAPLSTLVATKAQVKSKHDANEEILSALGRRGPDALDVLLESLEAEEDVHKHVIERIRDGEGIYFLV